MTKWTQSMRRFIYRTLTIKFGQYSTWHHRSYPNQEQKEEFEKTLHELANYFHSKGADIGSPKNPDGVEAVRQQIEWATTTQPVSKQSTWLFNKAAALEVGFIQNKEVWPN